MKEKHEVKKRGVANLPPDKRREIASNAAKFRWSEENQNKPVLAKYGSPDRPLKIGDAEITCYVLADKRRVLSQSGLQSGVGMPKGGGHILGESKLSQFLMGLDKVGVHTESIISKLNNPIKFIPPNGGVVFGYEASILPELCSVIVRAGLAGKLGSQHDKILEKCLILQDAFNTVGIIALVDEATGYQQNRAKDELQRILEAYVVEEMRPWIRTFPTEFFRQVYRLMGWKFKEGTAKRTPYVGKLINEWVYGRLPTDVLPKLKELNPAVDGKRKKKHFQFLTEETGIPHLDRQLAVVTALMRASKDRRMFDKLLIDACPKLGDQAALDLSSSSEVDQL